MSFQLQLLLQYLVELLLWARVQVGLDLELFSEQIQDSFEAHHQNKMEMH
jgi:hypothetical protein